MEKLKILGSSARYDVSCASSGVTRSNDGRLGNSLGCGICHTFASDGRCVSLLKVLFSNICIFDCAYCINRASNDIRRTSFTVDEIVRLTMDFYRRNYIEGLFLSSGIFGSPDRTMLKLAETARRLRRDEGFSGYIHLKSIPGASPRVIRMAGMYADRLSVNIELPSETSLNRLAPEKEKRDIFGSMGLIRDSIAEYEEERGRSRRLPDFTAGGQSTQVIIGASPEDDYTVLNLSSALYNAFKLRRVYYSAYTSINRDPRLPDSPQGLLHREHRLYQADWLIRVYRFGVDEIITRKDPNLDPWLDPKLGWALNNLDRFPVEVVTADYDMLMRVPGIGFQSARRIISARRQSRLSFDLLKSFGVVLKRARYFLTCGGRYQGGIELSPGALRRHFLLTEAEGCQLELLA